MQDSDTLHLKSRSPKAPTALYPSKDDVWGAGETLLEEAVELASSAGLVRPHDHVVVVQMVANSFVVKIITVDGDGDSIKPIRPASLMDLIKVRGPDGGPAMFDSLLCMQSNE